MGDIEFTPEQIRRLFGTEKKPEPEPLADDATEDQMQRHFIHRLFNQAD